MDKDDIAIKYKRCPECLTKVPINAVKCPSCDQKLERRIYHKRKYHGGLLHQLPSGWYVCQGTDTGIRTAPQQALHGFNGGEV